MLLTSVAVVGGCAHQPTPEGYHLPVFWSGLLHGFLILFSFIGSLFADVRIYSFPNSGGWYDFGYLIGAAVFLGGGEPLRRLKFSDAQYSTHELTFAPLTVTDSV